MKFFLYSYTAFCLMTVGLGFWDAKSSTLPANHGRDWEPRQSFFRWQETIPTWYGIFFPSWDWHTMAMNRRTVVVAGVSIDFLCLGTATILNRRTVLTAANLIDPWFNRQRDLRIWALGNKGTHKTPYRYRVWRITRVFPKSLNPEHWHGARGIHSPRHDICIIHTLDQMFLVNYISYRGMYPARSILTSKHKVLAKDLWFTGSGYEYLQHIKENYKIFITMVHKEAIVDCSKYLPKWWGKFICFRNVHSFPGVQNGGGFHSDDGRVHITGLGCFEIRYNEDRIIAFTDLRYYVDWIALYAHIRAGEYYEYAYPQWGIKIGYLWNTWSANDPNIPHYQVLDDLYPLGK